MMNDSTLRLHPENPHTFLFRGEPTLLITSAEHYGSVINLDFDYVPYLDVLAQYGMNATRIYAGAYLEPEHYFIHDNPLGPPPGRHCLPWGRSSVPGYPLGGNKFDLDTWNPDYFKRLKDFIDQAGRRGIVVEICLFNAMYPETWTRMPLYHENNIQGIGRVECKDFQTLKDAALIDRQVAYVQKITREVEAFDNVILEVCDEPGIHGTLPEEYAPWLSYLVGAIADAEQGLPRQHLIAQQVCGNLGGIGDLTGDPRVLISVGQYIGKTSGAQFGGVQLLDADYGYNKPIELNETAYYPIWYEGDILGASRVEAWEFILGGGASFNQLNGLFSTYNPSGEGTDSQAVLSQLKVLKEFMAKFNFIRMRRDPSFLIGRLRAGMFMRAISEPGQQYALYLHHSTNKDVKYIVTPGNYEDSLVLRADKGWYQVEWIEPVNGKVLQKNTVSSNGRSLTMVTPAYTVDIALRMVRVYQTEENRSVPGRQFELRD